jgi:serine/threonine-protein kinase
MGEVVLADDTKLGRKVAIKRMRAKQPSPAQVLRFVREARIQALLDHPAIVPVHELGHDDDGRPYFTMKRLTGRTLDALLREGKTRLQQLLRAFVDVCLAIEYAHERNVVHRDLKPANVMLGDYGEVYVLDWGVARVLADADETGPAIESHDGLTKEGALMGTPGYISPEQMHGDEVTSATDIYALGAILFEILAGETLHPRVAAIASTLADEVVRSPAQRFPARAIAPELDSACVAALATDAAARPRARELADRVQRYLDGDRDVERRRIMAVEQVIASRVALASASRADAMRFAGRALALDPESRDAAALVMQLVFEPPDPPPPSLAKRLDEIDLDDRTRQGRSAALALSGYLLFVPALAVVGVNDWLFVGGAALLVAIMIAGCLYIARRRSPYITWTIFGTMAVLVCIAQMFSPIVIVPALAVGSVAALTASPTLRPSIAIAGMAAATIIPLILQQYVLSPMTSFSSRGITITPALIDFGPASAPILITTIHIAIIVIVGLLVRSLARARRESQRKLERQAWMLEQLLPAPVA